ncbi:MAG TPA: aldehyde ferredoxin oxidoreductase [Chloroflexi bacterium]|nr:aldehyde ferredoxin oxidoreductase [Chloroflexota bacterium]
MFGWYGKVLRVNLTNEEISVETVDPQAAKDFIGGRGWAIKYLYDEVDPTVDPLALENKLIFGTGPLTATPAPTGNRYMVVTKSPLTGALSCSNSGGMFPTEMKRTGFDLFIFEGKAERPVYLWVNDDQVEIRPAEHVWGKTVPETEDILLEETDPKAKVACIGPAGERLVKIASIMNDKHRAAGRSGVGAVMGSKNLKAVVVRGTQKVALAEPDQMQELCRLVRDEVNRDVKKGSALREYGTAYVPIVTNEVGILPTRNFQSGVFEGVGGITGRVLKEKYLIRPRPCFGCPIACGRLTRVEDPVYSGEGEGPEYETIAALGSACGVDNMAAVTKANYLCNELGLDTISAGMTIACAMEMYEKGVLPESDVGYPLRFGDADAAIDLVEKTAYRENFGDTLAEGSYRLAEKYGHPEFSITAKKLEFPGYDPRGSKGMGLLYATSNIGASHMAGDLAYAEVFGVPEKLDPLTVEEKPRLIKRFEDAFAVVDAAGLCVFLSIRYLFDPDVNLWPTRLTRLMNYATGAGYMEETLLQAGERIFNLERLFLLKAGFTREDDTLPKRMLEEPMPDGPARGHVVELDQMLPEFYRLRGWDEEGVPTDAKLAELGLAR